MFLGNDVVHWSGATAREKETRSRGTTRFIDRVLHNGEHLFLDQLDSFRNGLSAIPLARVQVLWALWAAKEAAFKAAMKAIPGLPFSPRSIHVTFLPFSGSHASRWPLRRDPAPAGAGERPLARGIARVRDDLYEILWEYHEECVHALALGPIPDDDQNPRERSFSDHWSSVTRRLAAIPVHRASAAVRRIALDMCTCDTGTETHQHPESLQIVRNLLPNGRLGPPLLCGEAPRDDLDLTLSHDGPWGAAGVLRRAGGELRGGPKDDSTPT